MMKRIMQWLGMLTLQRQSNENNNPKTKANNMKEHFISMAPDEESNAKVNPIDNNKTLFIDQFTTDIESDEPQLFENIQTIGDAFAELKPKVEVGFTAENGEIVSEELHFAEIRDFETNGGEGRLVQNSQYLSELKSNLDLSRKMQKSIKQNQKLRKILADNQGREELKQMLTLLLEELEQ